jgi:hypothetical protein
MATIKLREINPVVFGGNVGIGDENPSDKLVITGGSARIESSNSGSGLIIKNVSSFGNWSKLQFKQSNDDPVWSFILDKNKNKANELELVSAGLSEPVMAASAAGDVGWGVYTPHSHFHVGGSRGGVIRLSNSTIGDSVNYGTTLSAQTDEDFVINNKQNVGGILLQCDGSTGVYIDKDRNVSVGAKANFGLASPDSRFVVYKSGLSDNTSNPLLHLWGKFGIATINDGEEYVSIRTTIHNSSDVGVTEEPIKFTTNSNNIDIVLGQDGGNVGIGTQITAPSAPLHISDGTLESKDLAILESKADNVDEYVGLKFKAANSLAAIRSYTGPSSGDSYVAILTSTDESTLVQGLIQDHQGYVGLGTAGAALDCPFKVKSADNQLADFHSTDTDAYIRIQDSNDSLYIGSDNGRGSFGGTTGAHANNLSIDLVNGNVGIGLAEGTAIAQKLHVAGYINIDGGNGYRWGNGNAEIRESSYDMILSTYNGTALVENFRLKGNGKLVCGVNQKPVILYGQDITEGSTTINVCPSADHSKDVVLYSFPLGDIEENDVIMANVNWGVYHTLGYKPNIYYGLILGNLPTIDFGDVLNQDYALMMQPQQIHPVDALTATYGSDISSGQTYTGSNVYGPDNTPMSNGFDDVAGTYIGWEGANAGDDPGYVVIDFGSGVTKQIQKMTVKPNTAVNGYGGIKDYKLQGSNDNSNWTDLMSSTHANNEDVAEHTFSNNTGYRYYRFYVSSSYMTWQGYKYASIYELELMEQSASGGTYTMDQSASAMHKISASDNTNSFSFVNFVLWAEHPSATSNCSDLVNLQVNGQMDVVRIRGKLT